MSPHATLRQPQLQPSAAAPAFPSPHPHQPQVSAQRGLSLCLPPPPRGAPGPAPITLLAPLCRAQRRPLRWGRWESYPQTRHHHPPPRRSLSATHSPEDAALGRARSAVTRSKTGTLLSPRTPRPERQAPLRAPHTTPRNVQSTKPGAVPSCDSHRETAGYLSLVCHTGLPGEGPRARGQSAKEKGHRSCKRSERHGELGSLLLRIHGFTRARALVMQLSRTFLEGRKLV